MKYCAVILICLFNLVSRSHATPAMEHPKLQELKNNIPLDKSKLLKLGQEMLQLAQSVKFKKVATSSKHQGVQVTGIPSGSILEAIGLRNEDIIIGINDITFDQASQASEIYKKLQQGKNFSLKVQRGQTKQVLDIKIK